MIPQDQQYQQNQAFNPATANWQEMPQQQPWSQFEQSLKKADPVLDFHVKHVHYVEHLMEQVAIVVHAINKPLYDAMGIMARGMWPQVQGQGMRGEDTNIMELLEKGLMLNPRKVVQNLGLDTDAFIALLTDHQIAEIQQMHEHNHNAAVNGGYAHHDPQQQAYMSPWGVSYQQGNQQYYNQHPQGQNPYQQSHYPNQPVGMQNPYGQPSLTGALFGLGLNYAQGQQ